MIRLKRAWGYRTLSRVALLEPCFCVCVCICVLLSQCDSIVHTLNTLAPPMGCPEPQVLVWNWSILSQAATPGTHSALFPQYSERERVPIPIQFSQCLAKRVPRPLNLRLLLKFYSTVYSMSLSTFTLRLSDFDI